MKFRTEPFRHQLQEWETSRDFHLRALFWEMGCGKTKLVLDTAAWLYETREIDGVLVIAPNGVHENWVTDELPIHMAIPYQALSYSTKSAATLRHKRSVDDLLAAKGLVVLAMSYDAFMTKEGRKTAERFLEKRSALYVLDESQRIKTPSAKRTRAVVMSGRRARYKRILTGTPITNSPFDVYAQLKFLDEGFWRAHGFASYEAFKTYFGIWQAFENHVTGGRFSTVVAYKNLDQLAVAVGTVASRVTKAGVLDLPEKLYTKRYFELSPEQARLYAELRDLCLTRLDSGELVTAPLVLVQLVRLQQILSGYLPSDDCETMNDLAENPRLSLLLDVLEDVEGKAIIFARFRRSVDKIMAALGDRAVRYDGAVDEEDRLLARRRFQEGDARYFVGNAAVAGVGLTLHAAKTVLYYENSFNLEHRLQSEDRAHRIGQRDAVTYIDLVARGTVDVKIVGALRKKLDIASKITGDDLREWL